MRSRIPWKLPGLSATVSFAAVALSAFPFASSVTAAGTTRPELEGAVTFSLTRDGNTVVKESLMYPSKITEEPAILEGDILSLSFSLKGSDAATDKSQSMPHQIFFFLTSANDAEVSAGRYIRRTTDRNFKLDLDTRNLPDQLLSNPGEYRLELVLGGFQYDEGLVYNLGSAEVMGLKGKPSLRRYGPLPEIHHQFRGSEKMVAPVISYFFVAVVLSPWLLLVALWWHLGVNVDQFPCNLSTIIPTFGFVCSLSGILVVIFRYWISVTLFPTLIYLCVLGLFAAVFGRQTLANMARQRLGLPSS